MDIQTWLAQTIRPEPTAHTPVGKLLASYRTAVGRHVPRSTFVAELGRLGYILGNNGHGAIHVAGVSDKPPKRWTVDDRGHLVLTTVS